MIHDQGASTSFLSRELADKLMLTGVAVPLTLKTFGAEEGVQEAVEVQLRIFDHEGQDRGKVVAKVIPKFADVKAVDWSRATLKYPHLQNITVPSPANNGECSLLLGNNCARLIAPEKVLFINQNNSPVAHSTQLGWSVAGPTVSPKPTCPWSTEGVEGLERNIKNKIRTQAMKSL